MKFRSPKFRFAIFLKEFNKENPFENEDDYVVCFADNYEIQQDGVLVLFQTLEGSDNKVFKMPVLMYPNGKWNSCFLVDDKNRPFVFNNKPKEVKPIEKDKVKPKVEKINPQKLVTELDLENEIKAVSASTEPVSSSVKMVSISNNPIEFKKQKEKWLEEHILIFIKDIELFNLEDFIEYLEQQEQFETFQILEEDILWVAAKIIKSKIVVSRKFYNEEIQQALNLYLPGIMKRHWNGSISPILEVLAERDETKLTNAIDLSVWMVQNNFVD
jgi:hypothetical protein